MSNVTEAGTLANGKAAQILDAAERVFAQYGFRKTNMGDILREAHVARATLYKHFGSKEDLFHAVLAREMGEVLDEVRAAIGGETTAAGRLRVAVVTHIDAIRRKANVLRVSLEATADLMSRWRHETDELTVKALDVYEEILAGGVASGEFRDGEPREMALMLLYLLKGLFLGVLTGHVGAQRDEIVENILDIIMNGLRPREEAA
ncbi:MAG: TetR/AcrR family transcriptional regulator [Candidatus Eisenbacteria bacterium]